VSSPGGLHPQALAEPGVNLSIHRAGVAASVADDLVARFPVQQVADALDVLPARTCSNAAGWLVAAISDGWQLHDEAQRLRATRTRNRHREAAAHALQARQEQRDRRLAGWATAVCEALTDTQLTAAIQQVTRHRDGSARHATRGGARRRVARPRRRPRQPGERAARGHPTRTGDQRRSRL
jgi:hypothetical protein